MNTDVYISLYISLSCILLPPPSLAILSTTNDVLELTDSNFAQGIANKDIILIDFFTSWCGYCKRLRPEFEKAASILLDSQPPIPLASVDCSANGKESCTKYAIRKYPTLIIFRNGTFSEAYNGPREAEGIAEYMRKMAGPPTIAVSEGLKGVNEKLQTAEESLVLDLKGAAGNASLDNSAQERIAELMLQKAENISQIKEKEKEEALKEFLKEQFEKMKSKLKLEIKQRHKERVKDEGSIDKIEMKGKEKKYKGNDDNDDSKHHEEKMRTDEVDKIEMKEKEKKYKENDDNGDSNHHKEEKMRTDKEEEGGKCVSKPKDGKNKNRLDDRKGKSSNSNKCQKEEEKDNSSSEHASTDKNHYSEMDIFGSDREKKEDFKENTKDCKEGAGGKVEKTNKENNCLSELEALAKEHKDTKVDEKEANSNFKPCEEEEKKPNSESSEKDHNLELHGCDYQHQNEEHKESHPSNQQEHQEYDKFSEEHHLLPTKDQPYEDNRVGNGWHQNQYPSDKYQGLHHHQPPNQEWNHKYTTGDGNKGNYPYPYENSWNQGPSQPGREKNQYDYNKNYNYPYGYKGYNYPYNYKGYNYPYGYNKNYNYPSYRGQQQQPSQPQEYHGVGDHQVGDLGANYVQGYQPGYQQGYHHHEKVQGTACHTEETESDSCGKSSISTELMPNQTYNSEEGSNTNVSSVMVAHNSVILLMPGKINLNNDKQFQDGGDGDRNTDVTGEQNMTLLGGASQMNTLKLGFLLLPQPVNEKQNKSIDNPGATAAEYDAKGSQLLPFEEPDCETIAVTEKDNCVKKYVKSLKQSNYQNETTPLQQGLSSGIHSSDMKITNYGGGKSADFINQLLPVMDHSIINKQIHPIEQQLSSISKTMKNVFKGISFVGIKKNYLKP